MTNETVFTMDTSSIKYGPGVTQEVGQDLASLGVKRVMLVTDSNLAEQDPVSVTLQSLHDANLQVEVFDRVRVEPTDVSFKEAIEVARQGNVDGYVAVGGGSVIDTAKAANLYATYPTDFLAYVNPPIGQGMPVPGKLKPLIALPTTAGTGSETTGVAIFDFLEMHAKTGIAHRALRPTMGVLDPLNTLTMPPLVTACSALDVLSHALESLTALPFHQRPAPESPHLRPAYQGANPISDIWSSKAIEIITQYLPQVIQNPQDIDARGQMMLAAAFAGIGFGNAGVHLPHGMSYPVSGMVRDYTPDDYQLDYPLIPHGMSVILNAPAVFRFTASANPQRHLEAARLMGVDTSGADEAEAGEILAGAIIQLMKTTGMPNGLHAVGFSDKDVEKLAEKTLPQHRVTKLSPRPADKEALEQLFLDAMRYW